MYRYMSCLPYLYVLYYSISLFAVTVTVASNEAESVDPTVNEFMCGVNTSIVKVITTFSPSQVAECLNITENENSNALPPNLVVLETTVPDAKYICPNRTPVYTFYCTVYGNELLWEFNGETVAAFLPSDVVHDTTSEIINYHDGQSEEPVYNVTATLTHVSMKSVGITIPICVSILTVHPFNESLNQPNVMPFTASCRNSCKPRRQGNETINDVVCQRKHYKVAATPCKPRNVTANLTSVTNISESFVSVNWLPPENEDETSIDYYELTISGPNTNNITVKLDSGISLPHKLVLPQGNFTTVHVTAVDMCGQRSEFEQSIINDGSGSLPTNPSVSSQQNQIVSQSGFDTLVALTVIFPAIIILLLVSFCILILVIRFKGEITCGRRSFKYEVN